LGRRRRGWVFGAVYLVDGSVNFPQVCGFGRLILPGLREGLIGRAVERQADGATTEFESEVDEAG
jgi:hypothetical protein